MTSPSAMESTKQHLQDFRSAGPDSPAMPTISPRGEVEAHRRDPTPGEPANGQEALCPGGTAGIRVHRLEGAAEHEGDELSFVHRRRVDGAHESAVSQCGLPDGSPGEPLKRWVT